MNHVFGHDVDFVDLSHPISEQTPAWPGNTPFTRQRASGYDAGGLASFDVTFAEHTGTHVDAPRHLDPGGRSLDALPIAELVGPVAVIDASDEAARTPDFLAGVEALQRSERQHGPIAFGSFVLIRTGWSRHWPDAALYFGRDAAGTAHFPGVAPQLAQALLSSRGVRALGIDSPSPDRGSSNTPNVHMVVLGADRFLIENLTNLESVPARGATLFVLPIPLQGGTGGPARVVAAVARTHGS